MEDLYTPYVLRKESGAAICCLHHPASASGSVSQKNDFGSVSPADVGTTLFRYVNDMLTYDSKVMKFTTPGRHDLKIRYVLLCLVQHAADN